MQVVQAQYKSSNFMQTLKEAAAHCHCCRSSSQFQLARPIDKHAGAHNGKIKDARIILLLGLALLLKLSSLKQVLEFCQHWENMHHS
jgi:hypothetical protein